jgi:hypothetical protein
MIAIIDFLMSFLFLIIIFNSNMFDSKQNYDQKLSNLKLLNNEFYYFKEVDCSKIKEANYQILKYTKFLKNNETLISNEICFKKD